MPTNEELKLNKPMQIPLDAIISASSDQVSTTTGTDVVILGLSNGTYYGLNEVGQCIWETIKQPIRVSEVCEKVTLAYDVDSETCQADVTTLLADLERHKLIQVHDAGTF